MSIKHRGDFFGDYFDFLNQLVTNHVRPFKKGECLAPSRIAVNPEIAKDLWTMLFSVSAMDALNYSFALLDDIDTRQVVFRDRLFEIRRDTWVLFLDVDGVINGHSRLLDPELKEKHDLDSHLRAELDPELCKLVTEFVDTHDIVVVLSSCWKDFPNVDKLLAERGIEVHSHTPNLPYGCRGDEIKSWLVQWKRPKGFVILDDDADMGELKAHLVQTDGEQGVMPSDLEKALKVLRQ